METAEVGHTPRAASLTPRDLSFVSKLLTNKRKSFQSRSLKKFYSKILYFCFCSFKLQGTTHLSPTKT